MRRVPLCPECGDAMEIVDEDGEGGTKFECTNCHNTKWEDE